MAVKKHGAYWLNSGWFPFSIGYVPNDKSRVKVMKYLAVEDGAWEHPPNSGRCTKLLSSNGELCILVDIVGHDDRTRAEVAGLVAHEASHAFDMMCEFIGETEPSSEFKAYTTQSFVTEILECIEIDRKRSLKNKKKTK